MKAVNARGQGYLKRYLEAVEIMSANGPGSVGYGWDTTRATELLSSLQARVSGRGDGWVGARKRESEILN